MITLTRALLVSLILSTSNIAMANLPDTIQSVKPSVVGVGTYSRLNSINSRLLGTGFAVAGGKFIATNAHVIPDELDATKKEKLVVFVGEGRNLEFRNAEVAAISKTYDLVLLEITGKPLKPLSLSKRKVREGEAVSFTGFPIGAALGLYPVTHRGIISAIVPIAIPARSAKELTTTQLKRLKNPYTIYQLDATAYPGNSGSPVYDFETGEVIAIINKVWIKSTKESLLSEPSAITYAIPVKYLHQLVNDLN